MPVTQTVYGWKQENLGYLCLLTPSKCSFDFVGVSSTLAGKREATRSLPQKSPVSTRQSDDSHSNARTRPTHNAQLRKSILPTVAICLSRSFVLNRASCEGAPGSAASGAAITLCSSVQQRTGLGALLASPWTRQSGEWRRPGETAIRLEAITSLTGSNLSVETKESQPQSVCLHNGLLTAQGF